MQCYAGYNPFILVISIHYGIKHESVLAEAIFNSIRNLLAMGSSEFLLQKQKGSATTTTMLEEH